MSVILLPDKWRRQPQFPLRPVDLWSSASSVVWTPGGSASGIDNARRILGVNAGLSVYPGAVGAALVANGSGHAYVARNITVSSGWVTLLALVKNTSTAQRNTTFFGLSSTASNNPLITLGTDTTTNAIGGYFRNDAGTGGVLDAALTTTDYDGEFGLVGYRSLLGTVAVDYFSRGVLVSRRTTAGAGGSSGPFTFNRVSVGAMVRSSIALQSTGHIALGLFCNRYVSDDEIRSLHENPWQVFRRDPLRVYFTAPSGGTTITGALESLTLSTFGATVGSARDVAATLESLALTTSAARVSSDRAVTASVEAISLTPHQAAIASDRDIAATLEAITVTGLTATVSTSSNTNISAALESITVTVNPATVSRDTALTAALESLTVTPHAASIAVGQIVAAALESLTLTSYPAGIALDVAIAGGLEQINLTTLAAQIGLGSNVAALVEAITLTEFGATLTMTGEIAAALESIGLTTFVATVVGGESALTTPGLEFTIPVGRMHYAIPIGRIHFTIPRD